MTYHGRVKVAWALALLAGCYGPSYAPGAPCDPAIGNCPTGQSCQLDGTEYRCLLPGTAVDAAADAEIDASTDNDGDGIPNTVDNCPTVANPDQHDEETDTVGDVCDPCPITGNNSDGDGDGVGDECDPRPKIAGDSFVVFEPFAGAALPVGWTTGNTTWTVSGDELRIASSSGVVASVRTNLVATPRMMAVASVIPDQAFGAVASVGMVMPYASQLGGGGIQCSLFQSGASRLLSLYDLVTNAVLDNDPYPWTDDTQHVLLMVRSDTNYQCSDLTSMTAQSAVGTSATQIMTPTIGLRTEGVTARFQYLMIVKVP